MGVKIMSLGFRGARVWVDGHELQELTDIGVTLPIDDVARLSVTCNITNHFEFVGENAQIDMTALVLPGYRLVREDLPDGRVSWRGEWVTDQPPQEPPTCAACGARQDQAPARGIALGGTYG